jgi:hypothetical protein
LLLLFIHFGGEKRKLLLFMVGVRNEPFVLFEIFFLFSLSGWEESGAGIGRGSLMPKPDKMISSTWKADARKQTWFLVREEPRKWSTVKIGKNNADHVLQITFVTHSLNFWKKFGHDKAFLHIQHHCIGLFMKSKTLFDLQNGVW